jgi:hypothetical protein
MLNIQLQPGDLQGDIVPQEDSPTGVQEASITLQPGNSWYSPGGAFRLTLQDSDTNLVWQVVDQATLPPWQQGQALNPANLNWIPVWSPFIQGQGVTQVDMQIDGNLVAYAGRNPANPGFNTNTFQFRHAFLRLQDDGNLVVYDSAGVPRFATNTSVLETPGKNT